MESSVNTRTQAIDAFWEWFSEQEEWIVAEYAEEGSAVIGELERRLAVLFPQYRKPIRFDMCFEDGSGEFILHDLGIDYLLVTAHAVRRRMPDALAERWRFRIGNGEPGVSFEESRAPDAAGNPSRRSDAALYLKKNAAYYLDSFRTLESSKVAWNFAAFFLGATWMIYRRMYLPGILLQLTIGLLSRIFPACCVPLWMASSMCISLLCGFYGNRLYKASVERRIERALAVPEERKATRASLAVERDTDLPLAILLPLVIYAFFILTTGTLR